MKKELLAPAGDIEAGYAALYYGADAVYLGLKQFSARATANNFSEEELGEFTTFAHHLKRKVFVTINTVLQDGEINDLLKNLDICKKCGVDAVIVQDLGVARIVKKYYPEIEMHASTQMAVHNKHGAEALKKLGFSRVVLARELTLSEMKEIAEIPNLELEAFVHGALCYSYSGICQFSSMMKGRSSNRGKCLYPCRAKFEKKEKSEHLFSMKDMALEEDVLKMPIYSLKIEGRKKTALYVAAVTDYYRNILDGNGAIREKAQNIKQIFSRPWCKFHFKGKDKNIVDKKFVGHRGLLIGQAEDVDGQKIILTPSFDIAKHDGIQIDVEGFEKPYGFSLQKFKTKGKNQWEVKAGEKVEIILPTKVEGLKKGALVYLASSSKVKGAYDFKKPKPNEFKLRQGIDVKVEISANEVVAQSGQFRVELKGEFTPAKDVEKMNDAVKKAFQKTGDTKFDLKALEIENKSSLFVPVSVLNDLRRRLYEKIYIVQKEIVRESIVPREQNGTIKWIIKVDDTKYLSCLSLEKFAEIIFLINKDTKFEDILKLPKDKLRIALPTVCRCAKELEPLIFKLIDAGYRKWEIGNYWGLGVLPLNKIDLSFDNMIYMFNAEATQMAKEIGASRICLAVEDTLSNMKNMSMKSALPVVMPVYQDVPLFTSAVCIRENSCKDCSRQTEVINLESEGQKYVAISKDCQIMMFANKPFCVAKEAKDVKADFYRMDFVNRKYEPEDVLAISEKLMNFEEMPASIGGNVKRRNESF